MALTDTFKVRAWVSIRPFRLPTFGLSIAVTNTDPRETVFPDKTVALSVILTLTPCSIKRAANATERSSSPLTVHAIADAWTSTVGVCPRHGLSPSSRCWGTVTAASPYIMLKFQAVVSYMSDEPSRKLRCRSSTRTDLRTSASNSSIAATKGASGCRLGIIKLP